MISPNKNLTVAVIGSEGFLGNNVCRKLLASGYKVKGLVFSDPKALEGLGMEQIVGDINNPEDLSSLITDADIVINCVSDVLKPGQMAIDTSYADLAKTNIDGVTNIVNSCIQFKVKRLIHCSTIQALQQHPKDVKLNENRSYVDKSGYDYDRCKADGDKIVIAARERGLDAIIMIIGGMLGPNDFKPTVSGQFIIDYSREKKPVPNKGGYDWVDVRDVAEAIVNSIDKGGKNETYILNGKFYSMIELCTIMEEVLGKPVVKSKISVGFIKAILPLLSFIVKFQGNRLCILRLD
ncbi:MAG: NAD-dependent epimerase/dehydratase family protein [Chitinophagales bacterium]